MDSMLLGETLAADEGATFVGNWMPAGGNSGIAAIQLFAASITDKVTLRLDSKSSDEDDAAAVEVGSRNLTSSAPDIYEFAVTDAKDLVRYVLVLQDPEHHLHFQFLQPTWAAH